MLGLKACRTYPCRSGSCILVGLAHISHPDAEDSPREQPGLRLFNDTLALKEARWCIAL